jgi:glycosyltransferase involved in cell wall biosynthesis
MESKEILLSILIPTKDRYECLLPVLTACLKYIPTDKFEIIVQDNSNDNSEIQNYLRETNNEKLKYFYTQTSLSITENTILAVSNAKGKYITFIGDDDLVSPFIIDIVDLMIQKNISCLIHKPAHYWWNTVEFAHPSSYNQKCALWMVDDISIEPNELDAKKELEFVIQSGAVSYFNLPRLYHGIVKMEVLEIIKQKTGTYLPGGCPDISFATALALVVDTCYYIHYPVTVFGASKNSGGGMSARNAHFKTFEEATFVSDRTKENWDEFIPRIWSAHTWYANSVQEVLKSFKVNRNINFIEFYGSMLAYESNLNSYLKPLIHKYCKGNLLRYLQIIKVYLKKLAGIYYRKRKFEKGTVGYTVKLAYTVDQCMLVLSEETNLFSKAKSV